MSSKSVDPAIYDENYYLNVCLGSEEFKQSGGKQLHPRLEKFLEQLDISKSTKVLDIGCGRGDITLYLAKRVKESIGIDYSREAIRLADKTKKTFPSDIQKKTRFELMNVKKMKFSDNYFDVIICIDVLEHLYKDEAEEAIKEIKRVLKPDGILLIHTGTNKLLHDYTYKYYILPVNKFLTKVDHLFRSVRYSPLPEDPRTLAEKTQHVNEPTYFYLKKLFKKYKFKGDIKIEVGYIKPVKSIKTIVYNALIALYPISKIFPMNILFGWVFIASLQNKKVNDKLK